MMFYICVNGCIDCKKIMTVSYDSSVIMNNDKPQNLKKKFPHEKKFSISDTEYCFCLLKIVTQESTKEDKEILH